MLSSTPIELQARHCPGFVVSNVSSSGDGHGSAAAQLDRECELVGETHTESEGDNGGVTPRPASAPRRTAGSTRDGLYRVPSWSGGNGLAELFVRMDLGVDFGGSAWW